MKPHRTVLEYALAIQIDVITDLAIVPLQDLSTQKTKRESTAILQFGVPYIYFPNAFRTSMSYILI